MTTKLNVLILGASYGSLLATKILLAGHDASLVCTQGTADLIGLNGTRVRFPVKGLDHLVEVDSRQLKGQLRALTPQQVRPGDFDLVCLAMQEPQYGAQGIRELMHAIAAQKLPCLSIMNMPPLPYLQRMGQLSVQKLTECYRDPEVWSGFDPRFVTLCSPDPQAFRPNPQAPHVLQVGLATNFKAACFDDEASNAILFQLEHDIAQAKWLDMSQGVSQEVDLPVKLKVHRSIYVPLAKWCMLMTGNYRCVLPQEVCSIQNAVHQDLALSKSIYEWVEDICFKLGAAPADLVPFEKYALATQSLLKPSSVARSLAAGAVDVERLDRLVQLIAQELGLDPSPATHTVNSVNGWLERNKAAHLKASQAALVVKGPNASLAEA